MIRRTVALLLALGLGVGVALAQTGDGSIRGYVKDEQGGVLPGVTLTATSPDALRPATAVTDAEGYYRLVNLSPGTYVLTAELSGFATYRREGVLVRAGATFQVDIQMKIGSLEETITVSGESPMIEVSKPSNVLNIDGDFQKNMPIAARKNWSDFLEMTPGVHSRPFDDGSGRMVYFGHSTEHFAHVVQLEGMQAGNYNDFQLTYVQMGSDMIQDTQVKTGGVDASTPMGTGLAINVITKSGGNSFHGSGGFAYQPLNWNGDNTSATTAFTMPSEITNALVAQGLTPKESFISTGGTPAQNALKQFDGSFGGPIRRDKIWFFGSMRYSNVEVPIARTSKNVSDIQGFYPDAKLFNNLIEGYQPYVKVTGRMGAHELEGVFQRDRTNGESSWEYFADPLSVYGNGGNLYMGKITSVWGQRLTTSFMAGYNDKGGSSQATYKWSRFQGSGPEVDLYSGAAVSGGRIRGDNLIVQSGNRYNESDLLASLIMLRGDATYFKEGWQGSHEFQTGFFIEPRNTYDVNSHYVNGGYVLEDRAALDYSNPSLGTVPFHRRYFDQTDLPTQKARDQDWGFYGQDNWKPSERLTVNVGLRADWVKRKDLLFNIVREDAWTIQPRVGFSYMLTADAKNLLRGSYVRVGEQVMGRDAITTFGGAGTATQTDLYDNNLDGVFETVIITPGGTASLESYRMDSANNHQPYLDEFIIGFRRQFPWQSSLDVAWIKRSYHDMWATIDVNGMYPSGPNQAFGGFGLVDPNQGIVTQQTNNTWSTLEYQAIEITFAKNMSHNFQLMGGFNRQWHHMAGTWNPTDPAGFIEPNAFANDANLYMPRGDNDGNSLPDTGNALSYGPTWMKYRGNVAGVWLAPFDITVAATYTIQAGPWSGSPLYRLAANDPAIAVFGPARITLPNGTTQTNPLSTRNRYVYNDRGTGQFQAPAIHTVGLKVGKKINLGGARQAEVAANFLNLLNGGDFTQYSYNSAYQTWSSDFLLMRNRQQARAFQLTTVFRF